MFASYGRLYVKVIEASCASFEHQHADTLKSNRRTSLSSTLLSSKALSSAYIIIDLSLVASDKSLICQAASPPAFCSLLPAHGKGVCLVGEEFVFERVLSTSTLNLTVYFETDSLESSPSRRKPSTHDRGVVGVIDIPITRLEGGKSVLQWYQLHHPISKEGLKSAIRMEILYSEDADSGVISGDKSGGRRKSVNMAADDGNSFTPTKPESNDNHNEPGLRSALKSHESESSMDAPTVDSKRLPTGLVDYVVVVGQEDKAITCSKIVPTRPVSSIKSLNKDGIMKPSNSPKISTSTKSRPRHGVVWDRFPKQDYPDNPLPEKIEWFVTPQGPDSICSSTRPAHSLSSFVLSNGDNAGQLYGIRLRYYIKTCKCENCNNSKERIESEERAQYDDYNANWWLQPLDYLPSIPTHISHADSKEVDDTLFTWISVDLSLLSRWPFIEQLSQCMEYLYMKVLLPDTIIYESKFFAKSQVPSHSLQWSVYPPFTLNYDQLIMALCFECPAPVPGLYSISMNIWGQSSSTPSNLNSATSALSGISSMKLRQSVPSFKVDFILPPTKSLPCCPYPITKLFEILNPRLVIDILCCALSESRILFHSSDLSKLPIICECIATLIYPLKWSHVYLPVVPASLLDLVEAPVPFMLGTHSLWLPHLPVDCLADVVVIDCDLCSIDLRNSSPLSLPEDIDRWLMLSLKLIVGDILSEDPLKTGKLSCQQASLYIQILMFDVMVALLKDVPQCLFYLDRNTPIFNRPLFLSEFTSPASQKCIKILSDTNAFHRFTDALHTFRLEFFVECSERFPQIDWMDEVEINPLTINTSIESPSDSSSATSASIFDVSSPISVSSPSYHEQYFGESTSLPLPEKTTKSRGHIPFFSSVKQLITPRTSMKSELGNTGAVKNSAHDTPTRHGHTPFPVAPTPMHKVFHSSFRAQDVEELIASSESANSANGPTDDDSHPPPLPRVLSRRFSFSKQKSANSASFRLAASRSSSDRGIDSDIDNILSDLATDPNSEADGQHGSKRSVGIACLASDNSEEQDAESDMILPNWLFYGKEFNLKTGLPEMSDILKHRLDLYLSHIHHLHKQQNLDPVLFIDIYDPSFADEGLSSIASVTRKRSSTFFADHITPISTASHDSGRISVRLPKKFFNESEHSKSALDLGVGDDQQSDDSSHSSRIRSATNVFGSNIDVVKKRLVLQRSSLVVGVGVNIAHSDSYKDDRRRSSGYLSARDRESRSALTSDSVEQMNTSTDVTGTGLSTHTPTAPSEGSFEYPANSTHSIDSAIFNGDDATSTSFLEKGSGSRHTPDHFHADIMKSVIDSHPFAPVIFEHSRLSEVMNMVNVWTLSDLAAATGESIDKLATKYAETVERDLCVSDFSIMYKNASKASGQGRADSATKRRKNTISNRFVGSKQSSTQLSHWLDQSPAHRSCSNSVLDYLKIVISGLDVPEHELNVIRQACYDDLKLLVNRGSLLEILKQSHSSDKQAGKPNQNNAASTENEFPSFFPLHSEAFALMTELFQEILSICTQQHDYLHAYDLLIAGGLYFDIGDDSVIQSLESRDEYVEFLNSSIKHHPIYQKPELWIAVLKLRLESNFSPTSTPANGSILGTDHRPPQLPIPLHPNRIHQVILETHAMLYMMHSLGLNPERAMLFVQNVVDLYDLDWKYFMELKLFLDRLWPSHRRRSLVTIGQNASNSDHIDDKEYNSDELVDAMDGYRVGNQHQHQEEMLKEVMNKTSENLPTKPKKSWFRW